MSPLVDPGSCPPRGAGTATRARGEQRMCSSAQGCPPPRFPKSSCAEQAESRWPPAQPSLNCSRSQVASGPFCATHPCNRYGQQRGRWQRFGCFRLAEAGREGGPRGAAPAQPKHSASHQGEATKSDSRRGGSCCIWQRLRRDKRAVLLACRCWCPGAFLSSPARMDEEVSAGL